MRRCLDLVALLLIAYVGLHLPRSFTLLYVLAGLITLLVSLQRRVSGFGMKGGGLAPWWPVLLLLSLFSVAYAVGMLAWGFWQWPADRLDLINAVLLPTLLAAAGMQAASLDRLWSSRLLLLYALGGLLYVLVALALAREPWWGWTQVFPSSIRLPWGAMPEMNVRSVEQNAYPALLLLPVALVALLDRIRGVSRWWGVVLLVGALLGAHAVWSLNGRLGWLALLLSALPVLWIWLARLGEGLPRAVRAPALIALLVAIGSLLRHRLQGAVADQTSGIWSQGVCDERLSLFAGFLLRLHDEPWGGRVLRVPYLSCGSNPNPLLLSANSGTVAQVHNVFLDIYFTVGLVPVLFLLTALVPLLLVIGRGFVCSWPAWDWQLALRWGWLCFLACQWLFQPLLYADGLLYYWSFFVVGLLAVEARRGFADLDDSERSLRVVQGCQDS